MLILLQLIELALLVQNNAQNKVITNKLKMHCHHWIHISLVRQALPYRYVSVLPLNYFTDKL